MGKTGTSTKAKRSRPSQKPFEPGGKLDKPAVHRSGLFGLLERLTPGRVVFVLSLLTLLSYSNALGGDFLFDDNDQVIANRDIRSWKNVGDAFTTHVWSFRERSDKLRIPAPPPYYRPMFTIALTVEYQLFGLWPQGWHIVNLFLHILCAVGAYYVLLLLSQRNLVAAMAAMLFAVYPIHVESVSWISGITDPLFGVFFLASFYWYLKWRVSNRGLHLCLSLTFFLLGAFSKETSLSMVGLVFIHEAIGQGGAAGRRIVERLIPAFKAVLPFLAVSLVYLVPRYLVLGGLTWNNANAYQGPVLNLMWTFPWVVWTYVEHLLWPVGLSVAYDTKFITSAISFQFLRSALPLAVSLILLIRYRSRLDRSVWAGLALLFVPLLPVLDIRQLSEQYLLADRYLYIPVAGWCLLMAVALVWLADRDQKRTTPDNAESASKGAAARVASVLFAVLVLGLVVGCARENRNWTDDAALWSNAARVRPQFWGLHYNAALALIKGKRFAEARERLDRAADLKPGEAVIFDALGRAYDGMGDTESAVANFRQALEIDPTLFESLNNLGTVYFRNGDSISAERQFTAALLLEPKAVASRFNLGLCLARQGKYAEAVSQFELVTKASPSDGEAYYELGLAYEKSRRPSDALQALEAGRALARSPELTDKINEVLARLRVSQP